jgi:iron complex outermembrane receptor protein
LDEFRVKTQKAGSASLDLADFKVSGDLFKLPMGAVGAAVYTEWRKEKFNVANDDISVKLDDIIGQVRLSDPTEARRTVKSLAAEVRVPLIKPGSGHLLHKADLSAAARYESFSEGYNSGVKPYFGLRYQPFKNLVLRASMTRAFRAPTLPQLFGGESQSLPSGLSDLRRPQALTGDPFDGSGTQRLVRQGGNPNLTPETAKIHSYGFVYSVPLQALKGLSFGSQFFHIEQTNIITTTGTAYIRQNEVGGGTADLVVRDPGTETYTNRTALPINILSGPNAATTPIQPGETVTVPGRIVALLDRVVNLAYQEVEGYDFDVTYDKRTVNFGRFVGRSTLAYTKFRGFTRTVNPAQNAGRDGFPRWRGQANLGWNLKEHNASFAVNYIPSYGDYTRDGYEVDPYYTINLNYGYDFPAGMFSLLDNTRITVGVDNALDKQPPLHRSTVGYDQLFVGRPQGRFFFLAVRKTL